MFGVGTEALAWCSVTGSSVVEMRLVYTDHAVRVMIEIRGADSDDPQQGRQ